MVFIYNFYIRSIVETDIPRIHFNFNVLGTLSTSENKETEVISALISNQSGTSLSANYPVQKTDGVMENTTQNSDTPVISNIGCNDANKELRYDEEMLVDSAEVFADGNVSSPVGGLSTTTIIDSAGEFANGNELKNVHAVSITASPAGGLSTTTVIADETISHIAQRYTGMDNGVHEIGELNGTLYEQWIRHIRASMKQSYTEGLVKKYLFSQDLRRDLKLTTQKALISYILSLSAMQLISSFKDELINAYVALFIEQFDLNRSTIPFYRRVYKEYSII